MKVFLLTMVLMTADGRYQSIQVTPHIFPSQEKCEQAATDIIDSLFDDEMFPKAGVVRYACTPYEP